jgi:outer membrane protein OmpA-like peptidoglycan-associated protein
MTTLKSLIPIAVGMALVPVAMLTAQPQTGGAHVVALAAPVSERVLDTGRVPAIDAIPSDSVMAGGGIVSSDNTPRLTADGRVMFFNSTRYDRRAWARLKPGGGSYDADIYFKVRDVDPGDGEGWHTPVNVGQPINTAEDDAVETISPNGGTIYYTSLKKGWVPLGGPFFRADLDGRSWKNITGLGGCITEFFLSSPPFRICGATIGAYGDVFYFATTAHSRSGNHEIWVSHLRDGVWSYPENLGAPVNDPRGSYAPFIAADGRTLYFTSRRPGGAGSGDVYVTVLGDSGWQQPINLGPSINTPDDDAFFSIPASGDRVYFSRLKDGVESIGSAPLDRSLRPSSVLLLTGLITDRQTGAPVEATITIEDLKTGKTIESSGRNGVDHRFTAVLLPGHDYGISASAPGYGFSSVRYTVPALILYKEVTQNIELERLGQGKSFALNNVFFDYNADTLKSESTPELERLVGFLRDHPGSRIMVSGHTDNIGSEKFNVELSRRRADAVRGFLLRTSGIDPSRIESRGYGSAMPSASNTTDEGRQKNRCVQFTILAM